MVKSKKWKGDELLMKSVCDRDREKEEWVVDKMMPFLWKFVKY